MGRELAILNISAFIHHSPIFSPLQQIPLCFTEFVKKKRLTKIGGGVGWEQSVVGGSRNKIVNWKMKNNLDVHVFEFTKNDLSFRNR